MCIDDYREYNYALYLDKPELIYSICGDFFTLNTIKAVHSVELSPVPLTLELLLLCNVTIQVSNDIVKLIFNGVSVELNLVTGLCQVFDCNDIMNDTIYKSIKHLHQLQNIIYKHTGIRLLMK